MGEHLSLEEELQAWDELSDEAYWLIENWPHRPLEARPIRVKVRDGGWGKPRFKVELLYDLEES